MKRLIFTLLVIFLLVGAESCRYCFRSGDDPDQPEIESGSVICPPGIYIEDAYRTVCPLDLHPPLPRSRFPGFILQLPRSITILNMRLNYVPYNYFRVDEDGTSCLSIAQRRGIQIRSSVQIGPGLVYVSYSDRVETGSGTYYYLSNGTWIPGDGGRISPGAFQGKIFSATPRTGFGWILTGNQKLYKDRIT